MADDLEERLRGHARAFEGLMSLIPADRYYEKDNSDQWRKKKQTPEEKRAAKKAKLDPANQKSVLDVLEENERKRKRERGEDVEVDSSDYEAEGREKPREGMKAQKAKKQKTEEKAQTLKNKKDSKQNAVDTAAQTEDNNGETSVLPTSTNAMDDEKAIKRREKEERKKEKQAKKQQVREAKRADRTAKALNDSKPAVNGEEDSGDNEVETNDVIPTANIDDDIDAFDATGMEDETEAAADSASSPSPPPDSIFSNASVQPSASSTSSTDDTATKATPSQLPKIDKAILQARLSAKIEALRAARKADGPDGRPARNRQELIEARRKKQESRKANKKEVRKAAREEEMKKKAEEELAYLRGSGSPLGSDILSPAILRSPDPHNFAFGRVAFEDGEQLDASGTSYFTPKPKTPQDAKTALLAAQNRASRLAGLDPATRADIEEKERWLNAKKKAHGERVRDDMNLLKKTLKRKEKMKSRSEKEWHDRAETVVKGKEAKQRKREENLAKRKEEKGGKGKKKAGPSKKRPGFEGGFRSKPKK